MNKLFKSIVAASVGVAMAIGVSAGLGNEAKAVHAAAGSYTALGTATAGSGILSWSVDSGAVTVTLNKASSSTNVYTSNTSFSTTANSTVRWYVGNVLAITAETGYKIIGVKIVNSTSSSYYGGNYTASLSWSGGNAAITADTTNITLTNCSSTTSGSTSTIEVNSSTGAPALYVTTSKQSRPSAVSVKYIAEQTQDPAFTIDKHTVDLVVGGPSTTVTATPNENVASNATYSWEITSGDDFVTLEDADTPTVTVVAKENASSGSCVLTASVTDCESKTVTVTVIKPLTVAEARSAIDAAGSASISNSYVTGIISQIDSYSSDYHSINYWISDDGTTTDQLEAYSGRGLNNVDFTSKDDIERGATVIIFGTLKKYNSTYEFDKSNYLISYTAPAVVPATSVTLDKEEMNIEVGFSRSLAAELNAGAVDSISWFSSNESVATVSDDGEVEGIATGDATITAFIDANGNGEPNNGELFDSCDVTVVSVVEYGDEDNPLTVNEAKEILDLYGEDETRLPLFVKGVVSSNTAFGTYYEKVWLQNGDESKAFELYKATADSTITSAYQDADDLAGSEVVATGKGKIYKGTYELDAPEILEVKEATKTLVSIALSGTYPTTFNVGDAFSHEGMVVTATYDNGTNKVVTENLTFSGYNMSETGEQEVTVSYSENGVPKTAKYTITVNNPSSGSNYAIEETGLFVKITNGVITDGDYLIVYNDEGEKSSISFDSSLDTIDAVGNSVTINPNDLGEAAMNAIKASVFTIEAIDGGYSIKASSGKYIGQTSDANGLKAQDNAIVNTISFDEGNVDIISGGAYLRYNSASNQTRFRYYKSTSYTGQKAIQLYRFLTPQECLTNVTAIKSIRGNTVTNGEDNVTAVNSLSVRFGVKIAEANWDKLEMLYDVQEYGVKMFLSNTLAGVPEVSARGDSVKTVSKSTTPDKDGLGNYNFMVVVNVPDALPTAQGFDHNSYFCVRPYVKIDNIIIWLLDGDMHESMETLLDSNSGTNLTAPAIAFLKTQWGI